MDTAELKKGDRIEVVLLGTVRASSHRAVSIQLDPRKIAGGDRNVGDEGKATAFYVDPEEVVKRIATKLELEPGDEIKDNSGARYLLNRFGEFIRTTGPWAGVRFTEAEMSPFTTDVYTIVTPNS